MKPKVIIENGETTIILEPENNFDTYVLKKIHENRNKHILTTDVCSKYQCGSQYYSIEIKIKELGH